MLSFNFPFNLPGFAPHTYRVIQHEMYGTYHLFWKNKDVLIGGFAKVNGIWEQITGRQMPEGMAEQLGKYIETHKLWI
ncbi:MAG: hypothetical protein EOO20_27155 [Chryseobacterium sp.]|nr:MAG: hypothetical protein EOO20_27155 [Chryseobacterium sp.]